jgi:3-oxoacyl-[acyl-carrier protein] reductase/meso-butanediol dehydrogenase/(S,S)-butanediol dehydrogenase/diacetyl reductase
MTADALQGRVAIVTGAGRLRGIGRATAVALAEAGADVVVTGTGRDPASYPEDEKKAGWRDVESTAEQIRAAGRKALTWTGDVSQGAAVDDLVHRIMSAFGRLDVLVNNAAYPRGNDRVPLPELDEGVWRKVLEIKLTGAFLLCKRIVPIMIRQKWGRIINLSSIAGKRGSPNTAAYNAANFGIQGLTQSLAMEVARHGITVNAVCPGTRAWRGLAASARPHPHGAGRLRRGGRRAHRLPLLSRRCLHDRPVRQHRRRRGHVVSARAGRRPWS